MEYEIELKLCTSAQAGPIIEASLLAQLTATAEHHELVLSNSYFDTDERLLRKNDMGLRIRGSQQHFEQTLKTKGKGVAGLQHRPEYNVSLGKFAQNVPEKPDLALFPADVWPAGFDVDAAQQNLRCQFSTHFTRSVYLLTWPDATQVELVWDRGEVQASGHSSVISEIELELKNGSVDILFNLAGQLAELMPVTIGLLSKAARGYRLMDEAKYGFQAPVKSQIVTYKDEDISLANREVLTSYLAKTLRQWQDMNLIMPVEHGECVRWGQELSTLLLNIDKIVQHLLHQYPRGSSPLSLTTLHAFQGRVLGLLEEVVTNDLANMPPKEVEQGLLALITDKQAIILQLELMQWLSKVN